MFRSRSVRTLSYARGARCGSRSSAAAVHSSIDVRDLRVRVPSHAERHYVAVCTDAHFWTSCLAFARACCGDYPLLCRSSATSGSASGSSISRHVGSRRAGSMRGGLCVVAAAERASSLVLLGRTLRFGGPVWRVSSAAATLYCCAEQSAALCSSANGN